MRAEGFRDQALTAVDAGLASAFDAKLTFNKRTLGEDVRVDRLGIAPGALDDPAFELLRAVVLRRCAQKHLLSQTLGEPDSYIGLFPEIAIGPKGRQLPDAPSTEKIMLYWALMFLIIAIVAGFLGFGGIAFAAAGIAKILFFIFLVIFVVMLLTGLMGRSSPPI